MIKRNVASYLRERFPAAGVALISISIALFSLGLQENGFTYQHLAQVVLIALVFTAFLLRQRVVDEFKDKHHDNLNFPDRPFQRGTISTRELIVIGLIAFAIEMFGVLGIGGVESLIWYLPTFLYSLLMAKEFFIGKWLESHFTTYFLVHEVIFIWFALWLGWINGTGLSLISLSWTIAFIALMICLELGRKFTPRKSSKGEVVQDTYSAVWGRTNTLTVIQLLIAVAGIALSYAESSLWFAIASSTAALVLNTLNLRDATVKIVIVANMLTLVGLGIII